MSSDEKKVRELKTILRQLQSIEMHPQAGVIEMRYSNGGQNAPAHLHGTNLPSLPPDQLKYVSDTSKKGPSLSTILFTVALSATISSTVIAYILYKDSWFPNKAQPTSQITLVKPNRTGSTDHKSQTDNLIISMKKRANEKLQTATELLSKGKVLAARHILLELTKKEARFSDRIYAKVAATLANTYDVTVLKNLPDPDAYPDRIEAEYWERQWYKTSAKIKTKQQ